MCPDEKLETRRLNTFNRVAARAVADRKDADTDGVPTFSILTGYNNNANQN